VCMCVYCLKTAVDIANRNGTEIRKNEHLESADLRQGESSRIWNGGDFKNLLETFFVYTQ